MKLIDILLEDTIEESIFKKIGSFLKSAFNKFTDTLKKVMNKLPFGKSTTIKIPVNYSLAEASGAFGTFAGTYVEHATAYYLAVAMKEAGLRVTNDISSLESNMNTAYDTMVQSASKSDIKNQVPDKLKAGEVLGKSILDEFKDLPDLALTEFNVKQAGGEGEKPDIYVTVAKPDLTQVIGYSLKATINTTDLTGVNWALRAAARFFGPEEFISDDGKYRKENDEAVSTRFPDFGEINKKAQEGIFNSEEYRTWKNKADEINKYLKDTFGPWGKEHPEATKKRYEYITQTIKLTAGIDPAKPAVRAYHFSIKEKFNNDIAAYEAFFDNLLDEFVSIFQKNLTQTENAGYNWLKGQLGIDTDVRFYAFLSAKATGKKVDKLLTTHHSPEFIKAVEQVANNTLQLTVKKTSRTGIKISAGNLLLVEMNFYQGFAFSQGYVGKQLGDPIEK